MKDANTCPQCGAAWVDGSVTHHICHVQPSRRDGSAYLPLLSFDQWYDREKAPDTVEHLFFDELITVALRKLFFAQREYSAYVAEYVNRELSR